MVHPEDKEPSFKVVDKRRFTEDGNLRKESIEERKPEKAPIEELKSAASPRPPMSFSLFVQSLAHQTMMGLGMVPWPESGLIKLELSLAKQSIDILSILKEKTTGNLSAEEQSLIDGMLYQLQVAYVEIAKMPPKVDPIIK